MKKSGKILLVTVAATLVTSVLILVVFSLMSPKTVRLKLKENAEGTIAVKQLESEINSISFQSVSYGNLEVKLVCDGKSYMEVDGPYEDVFTPAVSNGELMISVDGDFREYLECDITIHIPKPAESLSLKGELHLTVSDFAAPSFTVTTESTISFDKCAIDKLDVTYATNSWESATMTVNDCSNIGTLSITSGSDVNLYNNGNISFVSIAPLKQSSITLDLTGNEIPEIKLLPAEKAKVGMMFSKPTVIPSGCTVVTSEE